MVKVETESENTRYIEELGDFRDHVLRLLDHRQPDPDALGIHIYIGPISEVVLNDLKARNSAETFIVIFHSENDRNQAQELARDKVAATDRIIFCSLSEHDLFADKIGILKSLVLNKNVSFSVSDIFSKTYANHIERIQTELKNAMDNAMLSIHARLLYLHNAIMNLGFMADNLRIDPSRLSPRQPAVVCAAGPSLSECLPILKTYQDKLFIISIYRTLPQLLDAGITPDVVVHVDPIDIVESNRSFVDLSTPLIANASISPLTSSKFKNIIWCNSDCREFDIFVEKMGFKLNTLSLRQTVTVSALDFARTLGVRRVALIGSDLCLSADKRFYADQSQAYPLPQKTIEVEGVDGGKVETTPGLFFLFKAIDGYLTEIKQSQNSTAFYNCSNKGINIAACRNISFERFCESFAKSEKTPLQLARLEQGVSQENIAMVMKQARAMRENAQMVAKSADTLLNLLSSSQVSQAKLSKVRDQLKEQIELSENDETLEPFGIILKGISHLIYEQEFHSLSNKKKSDNVNDILSNIIDKNKKKTYILEKLITSLNDTIGSPTRLLARDFSQFEALKNINLDFIAINNPKLKRFIKQKNPAKSASYLPYRITLPVKIKFADERVVYSGVWDELAQLARLQNDRLIKEANIDTTSMAMTYLTTGNLYPPSQLQLSYPDIPIIIITPYVEQVHEISKFCFFTNLFSDKTTFICVDADQDWLAFYKKTVENIVREGYSPYIHRVADIDFFQETEDVFERIQSSPDIMKNARVVP